MASQVNVCGGAHCVPEQETKFMRKLFCAMTAFVCSFAVLSVSRGALGQSSSAVPPEEAKEFQLIGNLTLKFKSRVRDARSSEMRAAQRKASTKAISESPNIKSLPEQDQRMIAQQNRKASEHFDDQSNTGKMIYNGDQISIFISRGSSKDTPVERADISSEHSFQSSGDVTMLHKKADTLPFVDMPPVPINMGKYNPLRSTTVDGKSQLTFLEPWQNDSQIPASSVISTLREGVSLVSSIRLGDAEHPYCTLDYSDHKRVGNVWVPLHIVKKMYASSSPQWNDLQLSSEAEWTITHYSRDVPTIDDPMEALSKGSLVQDDDGKTTVSFSYDPAKSIESQHAIALSAKEAIEGTPKTETSKRLMTSSGLLIVAGVSLLIYWTIRKRRFQQQPGV